MRGGGSSVWGGVCVGGGGGVHATTTLTFLLTSCCLVESHIVSPKALSTTRSVGAKYTLHLAKGRHYMALATLCMGTHFSDVACSRKQFFPRPKPFNPQATYCVLATLHYIDQSLSFRTQAFSPPACHVCSKCLAAQGIGVRASVLRQYSSL